VKQDVPSIVWFYCLWYLLFLRAVVPPDQQCKLQGCTMPKYVEPGGRVHDFCGRYHAQEYAKQQQQSQGNPVPPNMRCKTPGCPLARRRMDDGSGYYDYCSLNCRDMGQRPQPSGMSSFSPSVLLYVSQSCFTVLSCAILVTVNCQHTC